MKQGIHPNYREVCFVDLSNGFQFVTRSTVSSKETIKLDDGREQQWRGDQRGDLQAIGDEPLLVDIATFGAGTIGAAHIVVLTFERARAPGPDGE